ncbi:hypothetical protein BYT27DRAFT_7188314 [Phlegmacium glaucopus]|nr:hypothetical protein BYT27DRAFT_7188314 [Phlegmacium glaucopus]
MSQSSANIGVPMIGSYTNVMLYTLELVEAYIYYFASPRSLRDSIYLKGCVAISLVSDTVGVIGICALTFITNLVFIDTITPMNLYWGFQIYAISNLISAFIFQCYMLHRYWILSRNYVVSAFIALLILASLGIGTMLIANNLAVVTQEVFQEQDAHLHERWIIMLLVTAILTDVSITTALLWQLNHSGLYNQQNLQTRRLVARISSLAIKTGVVPCVIALTTLVSYVSYRNQNIAVCVGYMLGRVYTSTMLFSLIYRDKLWHGAGWVDVNAATLPSIIDDGMIGMSPVHSRHKTPIFPSLAMARDRPRHDSTVVNDKKSDLTSSDMRTFA